MSLWSSVTDTATTHTVSVVLAGRSTPGTPVTVAVMATFPRLSPVTTPFWSTVAMLSGLAVNCSGAVMFTRSRTVSWTPTVSGWIFSPANFPGCSS